MRKKTKVIVVVAALLLVLPLTVFTIAEESGFFDSRSSAGDPWEDCDYSRADLDNDGQVGLSDFHVWMDLWREHEACERDVSKCRVGCVESMHGDDDNEKSNPGPIEAQNPNTVSCSESRDTNFNAEYDERTQEWSYTITGELRNGCLSAREEAEVVIDESGNRDIVSVTMVVDDSSGDDVYCTTAIVPFSITGNFEASENAEVNCFVRTVKIQQKSKVR